MKELSKRTKKIDCFVSSENKKNESWEGNRKKKQTNFFTWNKFLISYVVRQIFEA